MRFTGFVFVYVLLANDHVNNVSYFPFMSIKKVVPYFCVLREGYYVIIWLIVRRNKIKHWQKVQDREISDTLG
jgi:purine-cytosine permease-like protein